MTRPLLTAIFLLALVHLSFGTIFDRPAPTKQKRAYNLTQYEQATFGGGCFWCVEAIFERINGVVDVESGYSGGNIPNPTYQEVKSGLSGHAEVIRLTFDPKVVSYEQVLNAFFRAHDPTTLNRQGIDVGHSYRSVVFYHDETQKGVAKKVIRSLEAHKVYKDPIVTEVSPLINYYPAEDYHQNYFSTYQNDQYCTVDTAHISEKIEKFFQEFNQTLQCTAESEIQEETETLNTKPPLPTNIKVVRSYAPYHPWHNITYGAGAPEVVTGLIEITKGSRAKYEVDKRSGLLALDRLLHPEFPYPVNYGFIPQTLYGDGDGMDILVFSSVDIAPMTLVQARVVGMISLLDNNEKDDKLLAVVDNDVSMRHVQDIGDVPADLIRELTTYYENYKKHENITVIVQGVQNRETAHQAIKGSIQLYRDLYVLA